jgi:D-beta-D-heptose 7-phosphate kinase/D-beta-D-heptose 1-phosphate adenosyltransferase
MEKFKEIIRKFPEKRVLVIGDVMLDRYIKGDVERISPEAPVPVVRVNAGESVPGGAANVAANIVSLTGKASLFGFVGKDSAGATLSKLMAEKGIEFFPSFSNSTIEKVRVMSGMHQFLRMDYEEIPPKSIESLNFEKEAEKADAIIVSDYAKGAITPELMEKLKRTGKKIIVDPKPKNAELYKGVYLIKLNESEALNIARCNDVFEAGKTIREKLGARVIITRGAKGAAVFDDEIKEIPTMAHEVFDVSGAGDTVIAALALAIAAGANIDEAMIVANCAAGIKVEKVGTSAVRISEVEDRMFKEERKIKSREEMKQIIDECRKKGKKVVWANGCFDILHEGHVKALKKTREKGDLLVVGLNSDSSVRQLKGAGRPIRHQEARAEILASLECVDYVVIFDELDAAEMLGYLKPDIFVKSSDYSIEKMNSEERKILESYGAEIKFVPLEIGSDNLKISSSDIIDKMRTEK